MNLKQQIEQDLKTALLGGDKQTVMTLRGLKSAILYEEVAKGKRAEGMDNTGILEVLRKEAKKRQESADLYSKGGNEDRASAELSEKSAIEKYLPKLLSDEEISQLIDAAEAELGSSNKQNMGQVIGWVKSHSKGAADGAQVASAVKERIK